MSSTTERKLAAIMFTDIAGYTALSSTDENKALKLLDKQEEILNPIIEEFNGTLHNRIGDGLLFTFPTVTDAIKCGIKIQKETKEVEDLNLRIGIHEGEITLKNGDVLGDDVNVASRIDPYAAEGGIVISGKVQQNISSLPEFETKFISQPSLKGVKQDVKIFCIVSHGLPETDITKVTAKLEKDVKKLGVNQKTIMTTVGVLGVLIVGLIIWLSGDNTVADSTEKESIDIFISGVQSEKLDLDSGEEFLYLYAKPENSQKLDFNLIDEDKFDKLYQDVIIKSTTKLYHYNLVTLEDMQDRLASRGELVSFDEVPSIIRAIEQEGLFESEVFTSIGNFLHKENDSKKLYMFKIHAYEFTPTIDGNNIAGFVDFFDVNNGFNSKGFSTTMKNFGEDVSDVIMKEIANVFYKKYPSSILSVNGEEVLIKVNKLAKPKKMSTFNMVNRDYSNCLEDHSKFYAQRIEELERMISYCDTTQNNNYVRLCDMFLSDEMNMYIYSRKEYDDLLNNTHNTFDQGKGFNIGIEVDILIQEVFDSTAIGVVDFSRSIPWVKLKAGDKLILK